MNLRVAKMKATGLKYLEKKKVRQTFLLFGVNIISIPIGIITSIVLTRYLGPNGYGDYNFLNNIFSLCMPIFSFGFFYATNRALVLNNDQIKAREYYGASFVIMIALFIVMSIALAVYSVVDANLKEKHLNNLLLCSLPFTWVFLATSYFETLFQGDNRIGLLAISRLFPKIGFLIGAIIIYSSVASYSTNKLALTWFLFILTQVLVCTYIFSKINFSFKNFKVVIKEVWSYCKNYGFHVYVGGVFSVGVASLSGILISYFGQNNAGVGYFSLALALSSPLQFIPNTIATTNYKEFALHSSIPKKLTMVTIMLTFASLIILWSIVPSFINIFYGSKFRPVIYINFIASIGIACYGMADYYNRFLGANGHGKLLRNTSFIVGSFIVVFNVILIPKYGAIGAAYTRLIGGAAYVICMLYFYRTVIKSAKSEYV